MHEGSITYIHNISMVRWTPPGSMLKNEERRYIVVVEVGLSPKLIEKLSPSRQVHSPL